jgi:hypothetical protein
MPSDNPDRVSSAVERGDGEAPGAGERFLLARVAQAEFAVPARAVVAAEVAPEGRLSDLPGDARGVLWEGRYLFVEEPPGSPRSEVKGLGEFTFLVVRGVRGLSAIIVDRILGEITGKREDCGPPWAGRVRIGLREYAILAVAPPEEPAAAPPAAPPEPRAPVAEPAGAPVAGTAATGGAERAARRALVVDPRPAWRRGLARRLRERGFEVREAPRRVEPRHAAGIAFVGDMQAGGDPEAVAEAMTSAGWRTVLVTTRPLRLTGPYAAVLGWPVRDEDLDTLLAGMGSDEDARGKGVHHKGGGEGGA